MLIKPPKLHDNFWPLTVIFLFWLGIVLTNYYPGTWLLGWDSLVPELNFGLNIQRSILGTWQEYQGLGITGGMGHNADLVRQIILFIFSLVLPISSLRYIWHFLMLIIGPVGSYYFICELLKENKKNYTFPALVGSLFYLFNLTTVQYFFVPYEAFSSFYGFLPWVLLAFIRYLRYPKPRTLLGLLISIVLSSPAYYVQTLFVTLSICLSIFSLSHILNSPKQLLSSIKTNIIGYLIIIISSLFWLIPVVYFTLSSVHNATDSKQNRISTPEVAIQNREAGTLLNIAQLRGYLFSYRDYDVSSKQVSYLLEDWQIHADKPVVAKLSIILFTLGFLGLLSATIIKKDPWTRASLVVFIISVLMLTGGKGTLGYPYHLLQNTIPLFSQIFRTSFTKWSTVTALFLGVGLSFLVKQIGHTLMRRIAMFSLITATIFITIPIFQGKLFSTSVIQHVPDEYLNLFTYLETISPKKRILHLPSPDIWGWQYNDWGYRGSGFIWYGIRQSVLDRNFDTWSSLNEQAHTEIMFAIETQNEIALRNSLDKYQISLILFDDSIIAPENPTFDLKNKQTKQLLTRIGGTIIWQQGNLTLVEVNKENTFIPERHDQVEKVNSFSSIATIDPIYNAYSDYILTSSAPNLIFPFTQFNKHPLFSHESAIIEYTAPKKLNDYVLVIPSHEKGELFSGKVSISLTKGQLTFSFPSTGKIIIGDEEILFPTPTDYNFPIPVDISELVLGINDNPIFINPGETKELWLQNLFIGEKVNITVFDKKNAEISELTVAVNPQDVNNLVIPDTIWNPLLTTHSIPLTKLTDNYLKMEVSINSTSIIKELSNSKAVNCDSLSRGTIHKEVGSEYMLSAQSFASLCDVIILSDTFPQHDYWLNFSGENTLGRPLRIYLNDSQGKVVLEEITTPGNYSTLYSLEGSQDNTSSEPYSLHLNTKSMSGETAKNSIENIDIIKVPHSFKWIESIHLINENEIQENMPILELEKKRGTGFYQLTVQNILKNDQFLPLLQTFDKGWLAIANSNSSDAFGPEIKLLPHFKFNSWANAWQIPQGEYEVIIFYWPQVLVLVGYVLVMGTFIFLVIFVVTNRDQPVVKNNVKDKTSNVSNIPSTKHRLRR